MKTLFVARYSWLRLARSHYLKALWVMLFIVGMTVSATQTSAVTVAGKMSAVELGIKFARIAVWFSAIWIGMSSLSTELSSLTARTLLTKPVPRFQTVMGINLGGFAYLVLAQVLLGAEIFLIAWGRDINLGAGAFALYMAALLPPLFAVLALAQLVSLLLPKPIGIFVMVAASYESIWKVLADSMEATENPVAFKWPATLFLRAVWFLTPTYDRFVLAFREFERLRFPLDRFLFHGGSCLLYAAVCGLAAAWILSRKEI